MIEQRRRLTRQQKEAKLMQWDRTARRKRQKLAGSLKIPRDQIARLDAETIAVDRTRVEEAMELLRESGIKFWQMGPLGELCCRSEHDPNWLEA